MNLSKHIELSNLSKEKRAFSFNISEKSFNISLDNIFERKSKLKIYLEDNNSDFYNRYKFNYYFDSLNDLLDYYIEKSISHLEEYLFDNITNKNFLVKLFNKELKDNLKIDIEDKISSLKYLLLKDSPQKIRSRKTFFYNIFEPFFSHEHISNSLLNTGIFLKVLKPLNINDNVFLFDFEEQKLIKTKVFYQSDLSKRGAWLRKDINNLFKISNYYNYQLIDSDNTRYSLVFNSDKEKYDVESKNKYLVFYSEQEFSEYKEKLFNKEKELVTF